MNLIELCRALRQLRLSGMADPVEARLLQAQTDKMVPIDFLSALDGEELLRRQDRLLERRIKQATFRDAGRTLDAFDFDFNTARHPNPEPPQPRARVPGEVS